VGEPLPRAVPYGGFRIGQACPHAALAQVGASNELPESEELDALYDRFLIRRRVAQARRAAPLSSGGPSVVRWLPVRRRCALRRWAAGAARHGNREAGQAMHARPYEYVCSSARPARLLCGRPVAQQQQRRPGRLAHQWVRGGCQADEQAGQAGCGPLRAARRAARRASAARLSGRAPRAGQRGGPARAAQRRHAGAGAGLGQRRRGRAGRRGAPARRADAGGLRHGQVGPPACVRGARRAGRAPAMPG